jgi:Co/Zn/Cd efflux system component
VIEVLEDEATGHFRVVARGGETLGHRDHPGGGAGPGRPDAGSLGGSDGRRRRAGADEARGGDHRAAVRAAAPPSLLRAVLAVALLNLGYFVVEFAAALWSRSVALLADSADFLEDGAVNLLILVGLGWPPARRAMLGRVLAGMMLLPLLAFLWTLWGKIIAPVPPAAFTLTAAALGALAVNLGAAAILLRHRHRGGSLATAAFLSARNDALANVAIILAGLVTAAHPSIWPDVVVGLGIAWLNLDAARQVWRAAQAEGTQPG